MGKFFTELSVSLTPPFDGVFLFFCKVINALVNTGLVNKNNHNSHFRFRPSVAKRKKVSKTSSKNFPTLPTAMFLRIPTHKKFNKTLPYGSVLLNFLCVGIRRNMAVGRVGKFFEDVFDTFFLFATLGRNLKWLL